MSALRLGVFMLLYRQTYEVAVGSQSQTTKFTNMPTPIEWMEISIVYEVMSIQWLMIVTIVKSQQA